MSMLNTPELQERSNLRPPVTAADDPLFSLEHDHAELSRCVLDLGAAIRGVREGHHAPDEVRAVLIDLLAVLSEDVFAHFAREEEVLFPFVQEAVPELADDVAALTAAHDGICGALSRLGRLVQSEGYPSQFPMVAAMADRFADTYAEHSRHERAFLANVTGRLSPAQRAALVELARGL